jgi:hypothetical protein
MYSFQSAILYTNACIAASSKDRDIGAYSIGLTILEKLGCPNKEKEINSS